MGLRGNSKEKEKKKKGHKNSPWGITNFFKVDFKNKNKAPGLSQSPLGTDRPTLRVGPLTSGALTYEAPPQAELSQGTCWS